MTSPQFMQHTFGGNPLDRAESKRRDEPWLAAAYQRPDALILPFWRQKVLLDSQPSGQLQLAWQRADSLSNPLSNSNQVANEAVFLGLIGDVPHFAQGFHGKEPPTIQGATFTDCRAAAMRLEPQAGGIIAQSRSQLEWHKRSRYCGSCGSQTQMQRGGHLRVCGQCSAKEFPRTDPVVIMLITRGDRCLLGQPKGPIAGTGFYTSLAGFVDQGESIEEAVRRETLEEAGVPVGKVHYHSSQPWPFPHTLMIGCHGEALSDEINMDADEMADVRWFHRDEVRKILGSQAAAPQQLPQQSPKSTDGTPPPVRVPGPMAIAHHLINAWIEGEPSSQL